jgi:hypothetical protein
MLGASLAPEKAYPVARFPAQFQEVILSGSGFVSTPSMVCMATKHLRQGSEREGAEEPVWVGVVLPSSASALGPQCSETGFSISPEATEMPLDPTGWTYSLKRKEKKKS